MLIYIILLVSIRYLLVNSFFKLLFELCFSDFEECFPFLLINLGLLPVEFPNKRTKIIEVLFSLVDDLDILLNIFILNVLILLVHKLNREVFLLLV